MGKVVSNVLSGIGGIVGLGKSSPTTDTSAATGTLDTAAKKKARTQLLSTIGGANGADLTPSQVSQTGGSLFGN